MQGVQKVANREIQITINSKKLRDNEFEYNKSEKKRILVLGDSFAWGFGVEEEERFSEIIEGEIDNLEIINSAIAGYSSDQQLLYFTREGYKYHPDLVMMLFYENDFLGNSVDNIYWYNKPNFVIKEDSLVLRNVPVPEQSIYQKLRKFLSGKSYFISFILKRISVINVKSFSNEKMDTDNSLVLTEKIITQLNQLCIAGNSRLLLVSIPMDGEKGKFLSQTASKYSIEYLNLTPYFEKENGFIIEDDGHWNQKGHSIAADAISEWIIQNKFLSGQN